MKSLNFMCLFVLATLIVPALHAEEKDVSSEMFGKLALGQSADAVSKLLGDPEAKGKNTLWEAIGEWVQDWKFPSQGLTLAMASEKKGGTKTVFSITASAGCSLVTTRGIKLEALKQP